MRTIISSLSDVTGAPVAQLRNRAAPRRPLGARFAALARRALAVRRRMTGGGRAERGAGLRISLSDEGVSRS